MGDVSSNDHLERLKRAANDAYLLLEHLSSSNRRVEKETIDALVAARHAVHTGTVPPDIEASLWAAYDKLAAAASPVSIISLQDTSFERDDSDSSCFSALKKWCRERCLSVFNRTPSGAEQESKPELISKAYGTARRFRVQLIFWLFVLFAFQLYWSGMSIVSKDFDRSVALIAKCWPAAGTTLPQDCEKNGLARAIHGAEIESSSKILRHLTPWQYFVRNDSMSPEALQAAAANLEIGEESLKMIRAESAARKVTKLILEAIEHYILPLLYGIVGAYVYVLRTVSADIRTRTYRHTDRVLYTQRLLLGTVAGISIGLLFGDPLADTTKVLVALTNGGATGTAPAPASGPIPGTGAITPLALAFVAGYSVEILFALLDGIIARITGTTK